MKEHEWKKDKDGAESCAREGCAVRRSGSGHSWQKRKGAHWRYVAPSFGRAEPIPPCTGKDAAPDANADKESAAVQLVRLAAEAGLPVRYVPKPAPSPLEVVREQLRDFIKRKTPSTNEEIYWLSALATLEESIRAAERDACATAGRDAVLAHGRGATLRGLADGVRDAIRNRQ